MLSIFLFEYFELSDSGKENAYNQRGKLPDKLSLDAKENEYRRKIVSTMSRETFEDFCMCNHFYFYQNGDIYTKP